LWCDCFKTKSTIFTLKNKLKKKGGVALESFFVLPNILSTRGKASQSFFFSIYSQKYTAIRG